jgi:hypothetical protein
MSSALPIPAAPAPAASAPKTLVNSPTSDVIKSPEKLAATDSAKLCFSPDFAKNICECVSHTKCLKTNEPAQSSFGTTMFPSAVSAALVIIGWIIVHKAQSNRERRKQIREYVSNLCDDLTELESLAIGYHTSAREEAKEQEIISKLGRLEKACSTLPRFIESQKFLFKAVKPEKLKIDGKRMQVLRQAMTLNHFGDEHTGALGHQDDFILNLELAAVEVREALEGVRIDSLD